MLGQRRKGALYHCIQQPMVTVSMTQGGLDRIVEVLHLFQSPGDNDSITGLSFVCVVRPWLVKLAW